jgi:hypothetical protein
MIFVSNLPYFCPLLFQVPNDNDVSNDHGQKSSTVDAEDGDEKLDR